MGEGQSVCKWSSENPYPLEVVIAMVRMIIVENMVLLYELISCC